MKKALITGITGQDGSYLAEFLLKKKYQVHGIIRKSSSFNTQRIDHIYQNPQSKERNLYLYYGDLTDPSSISEIIAKVRPNEIYNLAAQSHVKVSFDEPYYTSMQAIKFLGLKKTKFYQASTSELYGNNDSLLSEKSVFDPRSPYAAAKLMAFNLTKIYRDSYNMFCANGILFNHESPRRGETFVTKKIVNGLVAIKNNKLKCLYLGNLNAKRDWGHAIDYVKAQWLILQTKKPDDYVIATGKSYSIRQFIKLTCKKLNINIKFKGSGLNEIGVDQNSKTIIRVDKKYFRPLEVPALKGNYNKARKILKWTPKYDINDIIDDMIKNEVEKK